MEGAHWYSLRSWLSDLILWSAATDLDGPRQGPVAALQISGAVRDLVREIPPNILQNGRVGSLRWSHGPLKRGALHTEFQMIDC